MTALQRTRVSALSFSVVDDGSEQPLVCSTVQLFLMSTEMEQKHATVRARRGTPVSGDAHPTRRVSQRPHNHFPNHFEGLTFIACLHSMDISEEVVEWLDVIGMESYAPAFRAQSVTGYTLLALNSVDLRKTLGVSSLRDRRTLLEGIRYLNRAQDAESKLAIPEDGRILTHLSNERALLTWTRFCIILETVGVVTTRLTNLANGENRAFVKIVSILFSVVAKIVAIYSTMRYFRMLPLIEKPGRDQETENVGVLIPVIFVFIGGAIAIFVVMSHNAEEAAILALVLLSV